MARHVSGTYQRVDRVRVRAGETVLLRTGARSSARRVTLVELSRSDILLSSPLLPPIGAAASVIILLRDRHIEIEVPGVVAWHREQDFALTFEYLTARQTYGLTLAIELERRAAEAAADSAHATRALETAPRAIRGARR
jgi:hypothetical protein